MALAWVSGCPNVTRRPRGSAASPCCPLLASRTAAPPGPGIGSSSKYIGCYLDDTQSRALRGVSFFDYKKMTVFRCQDNCAERGYLYAGLEFGAECYCGHKIQAANVSEAECDMECKGERGSVC
ncbi:Hypothetical predicted protein, partial [Marmota monax]